MKCRLCDSLAVISLPRHNSAFCRNHFVEFFRKQVKRAIKSYRMFNKNERILVCVSGGKDSLTLWHILNEFGYNTTGLYINLG
ncbi:MAG: tRNA(Ile)-lysidine synthetase, partial [Nitrospirae bacterium]|nr:tRNA(Ile)-lysidine synthetase [Nitrospirota bacterium]